MTRFPSAWWSVVLVPLNAAKDAIRGIRGLARNDLGRARARRGDDPVAAVFLAVQAARDGHADQATALLCELGADDAVVDAVVGAIEKADSRRWTLLEGLRRGEAIDGLSRLLASDQAEVRRATVGELAQATDRQRAGKALVAALDDADDEVRDLAVQALRELPVASAAPALLRLLDQGQASSRTDVITALGRTGAPEAVDRLAALVGDPGDALRLTAARALADTGRPEAVAGLITALGDAESSVRQAAADGLASLADPAAVDPLLAALADDDREVRWRAAKALGEIGAPSARAALSELAESDPDNWVRENATNAVDRLRD